MKILFAIACGAVVVYFLFLAYCSYRIGKKIKLGMDKRAKDRLETRLRVKQELSGISGIPSSRRSAVGSTRASSTNRDDNSDALVLASVLSASDSGSSGSYSGGYSSSCSGSSSSGCSSGDSSSSSD